VDPISQAALGAAVGHLCFHRQLGMRAAGLGAVAGMCPDMDTFWGSMQGPFARLVSHRGITHSLFFGPVVGTLFGWWYWYRRRGASRGDASHLPGPWVWSGLFVMALLSHPLLDFFTQFGTQLLAPFSRHRFALPAVPVVAPLYTAILGVGLALAAAASGQRRSHGIRQQAGWFTGLALVLSTAYLFTGLYLNGRAEDEAARQLAAAGIENAEVRAFPTMLQLPYRRIVAFSDDEVHVGYLSLWRPCPITWVQSPRRWDARFQTLADTREGEIFSWFSAGLLGTSTGAARDGLTPVELSDLRYGFNLDAQLGLWSIRGHFDDNGQLVGKPEYVRYRPSMSGANISRLWALAYPSSCDDLPSNTFAAALNRKNRG